MAIPKFLEDLLIISKLGDNPGSDNGLSSSGLRAKFDEAGVKIQQYINNTLIPALSELADPTAGLNMKANISMGGHRVTGLGEPVENGDAVPLGYAGQHFAPAGYGLGTIAVEKDWSDVDNLTTNGWYRFGVVNDTINNVGIVSALVRVDYYGYNYGVQTLYAINTASGSSEIPILRRTRGYGGWQPWECVNPPMEFDKEYRTTERWNGKPVYTKMFSLSPTIFTEQLLEIPSGIANIDCGLSIDVSWVMNGTQRRTFPSVNYADSGWNGQVYWQNPADIVFELGESLRLHMASSSLNIDVTVKYTKSV